MSNGKIITNTTIRKLTSQEYEDKTVQKAIEIYDEFIADGLGNVFTKADLNSTTTPVKKISAETPEYEAYEDDQKKQQRMPELDDFDPETYDAYLQAQVKLPVVIREPISSASSSRWDH
jgi:hypothetical protein